MDNPGNPSGETPGLDEVARTDRFIDALAAGRPAECNDPADRALIALMAAWRDELRPPPASGLMAEAEAATLLRNGPVWPRRAHRGLTMVGSAAAAVLTLGGFGAVVAGSNPGDALYGLRSMLFGEPKSVVDERIVLTAKTEMDKVQQMIAQGQWDEAQQRLISLGDTVQTVNDAQRRQDLVDQWNLLNVQVQKRDPNAVPPPSAPPTSGPSEYAPSTSVTTSVTLSVTPSVTPSATPTGTESAALTSTGGATPSGSTPASPTGTTPATRTSTDLATPTSTAPSVQASSGAPASTAPVTPAPNSSQPPATADSAGQRYPSASEVAPLSEASAYPRQ